jgi:hypothetical protein
MRQLVKVLNGHGTFPSNNPPPRLAINLKTAIALGLTMPLAARPR